MKIFDFLNTYNSDDLKSKMAEELVTGKEITATILNMKADTIILKNNGKLFRAKVLNNEKKDFNIGDKVKVLIKDIKSKTVFVDIKKLEIINIKQENNMLKDIKSNSVIIESIAESLLRELDIPTTKENIQFISFLMKKAIPLNKQTVEKAIYLRNVMPDKLETELLFFLEQEIVPTEKNIENFEKIINKQSFIKDDLILLFKDLENFDKVILKYQNIINKEILTLLENGKSKNYLELAQKAKLFDNIKFLTSFKLDDFCLKLDDFSNSKEVNKFFEKLYDFTKEIKHFTEINFKNKSEDDKFTKEVKNTKINNIKPDNEFKSILNTNEEIQKVTESLVNNCNKIQDNINFMKQLNKNIEFIQIPFIESGGVIRKCDIYALKEKSKNKNTASTNYKLVVALEYDFLGTIEIYIQTINHDINLKFSFENDFSTSIFKQFENLTKEIIVKSKYELKSISYNIMEKPFNLINNIETDYVNISLNSWDMQV